MNSIEIAAHRPLEATLPAHGVSVLESHHARDFQMEMARHDFFQLLYVLRGAGVLHCEAPRAVPREARQFSLQSGDVALLPPDTWHGIEDGKEAPLSIYAVNFAPHFLHLLPQLLPEPRRLRRPILQSATPSLLRRLLLEQTVRKEGFEAMMSGLGLELLTLVARSIQSPALPLADKNLDALARVHAYHLELERAFYRSEPLDSVAARLGISRRQFTELFRRVAGDSWLKVVRRLRVQHAQKLLRESERTVLAIAFECGFEELSNFYRAFKTEAGCSPDQWRKSARE